MSQRRIKVKKEAVSVVLDTTVIGVDYAKGPDSTVEVQANTVFSSMAEAIQRAAPSASSFAAAIRNMGSLASGGPLTGRVSGADVNIANIPRADSGGYVNTVSDRSMTFRQENTVPPPGDGRPGEVLYERSSGETYIHNGQSWVPMGTRQRPVFATEATPSMRSANFSFRVAIDRDVRTMTHRLLLVVYRGGQQYYQAEESITDFDLRRDELRAVGSAVREALHRLAIHIANEVIYEELARQIVDVPELARMMR